MDKRIEKYITNHYNELLSISKKITKYHDLSGDLLHDVILQLYSKDRIELSKYDDNSIRYYIVAILRINWFSDTSPFHYSVRREIQKYVEIGAAVENVTDEQYNFELQQIYDVIGIEYTELPWFEKSLLSLYLELGSLSKVAKKTTIPVTSVSGYMKNIRKVMKDKIINQIKNTDYGT